MIMYVITKIYDSSISQSEASVGRTVLSSQPKSQVQMSTQNRIKWYLCQLFLLYSFSSAKECFIKRIYIFNSILECFMFIILFICVLLHLLYFLILNWQTKYSTSLFTLMIIIFVFRCYFADRPTQIVLLTTRTTKN